MLTLWYPELNISFPVLTWAALAGYDRIYLGLHYPVDFLSGMLIGAGCSTLSNVFHEGLIHFRSSIFSDSLFLGMRVFQDGGEVRMTCRFFPFPMSSGTG